MNTKSTLSLFHRIAALSTMLFVLTAAVSIALPKKASAQVQGGDSQHIAIEGTWVDHHRINITRFEFLTDEFLKPEFKSQRGAINDALRLHNLGNYEDDEISDTALSYKSTGGACTGNQRTQFVISTRNVSNFNPSRNEVELNGVDLNVALPSGCAAVIADAGIARARVIVFSPANEHLRHWWFTASPDGKSMTRVDGKEGTFTKEGETNVFIANRSNCVIRVEVQGAPRTGQGELTDAWHETCRGGIANPARVMFNAQGVPGANIPGGPGSANSDTLKIDCEFSLNPLTWLMCPMVRAASETVTALDEQINKQLTIDTQKYFGDGSPGTQIRNAWGSFRNIALGLLVIVGLLIIIGNAASFDFLDAYTIKRAAPRLAVAVILLTLSWPLLKFSIDVSNLLGNSVKSLIYAPFSGLDNPTIEGGTSTIALGGIAVAGGLFGIMGLLSFGLTALMAVVIAFAVLTIRQILIILLVIISPVAIICNILPNTQKVWNVWWDFFSRALMVFPIIMAFIAMGRVFAALTYTGSEKGIMEQFIMFAAYFGPYFALPTAFRLAGGAIANISGMANDRSRGAFDRVRKFRQTQSAKNVQDMRTGERFNSKSVKIGGKEVNPFRALNRATSEAATFAGAKDKFGYLKNKDTRDFARAEQLGMLRGQYARDPRTAASQFNDSMLQAQMMDNEADARANLHKYFANFRNEDGTAKTDEVEKAISAAKANGGWSDQRRDYAARQLFATGTGYDNSREAAIAIAKASHGNKQLAASIYGEGNSSTERAGRLDMKVGFPMWQEMVDKAIDSGGTIEGETYNEAAASRLIDNSMHHKANVSALEGNDVNAIMRGKTKAVANLAPAAADSLYQSQMALQQNPNDVNAQAQAGRMAGLIEKLGSETMYVSAKNIDAARHGAVLPTSGKEEVIYDIHAPQNTPEAERWRTVTPPALGNRTKVQEIVQHSNEDGTLNSGYSRVASQSLNAHSPRNFRPEDLEAGRDRPEPPAPSDD